MSVHVLVTLLVVLIGGATLGAGDQPIPAARPTLLDQARKHGGISRLGMGCGFRDGPPTLETLLEKADVVVHGTVVAVVGRLSDDHHEVWTDYTIQPTTIVFDGTPGLRLLRSSELPVFTAHGGTVFVEGLKITETVQRNGSRVQLDLGAEVVLFGSLRDGGFQLEPFGVFPVQAGRVSPNGRWPQLSADRAAVDLTAFLSRVSAITSRPEHARNGTPIVVRRARDRFAQASTSAVRR